MRDGYNSYIHNCLTHINPCIKRLYVHSHPYMPTQLNIYVIMQRYMPSTGRKINTSHKTSSLCVKMAHIFQIIFKRSF